jgi:hypothetical protein
VFLRRPRVHRNAVWEADHVEMAVEVDVEGRLVRPWVTWFVDTGTNVVCGAAVSPGPASRESILAALRAAVCVEEPHGPAGGLPELVRIDRGKDLLSSTVASVMAAFAVRVEDLPAYTPHLKGSVETVNGASERMFVAGLPRYTHAQRLGDGRMVDPDAPALTFEAFVGELLAWIAWWNAENVMPALDGRTPLQAWTEDPTPLTVIPMADLRLLMMEDDGRDRKITTKGVAWRGRAYVGAWMSGQVGRVVRLRHMPHHGHEIEVFDARTGEHLGAAHLADAATPEQISQVRRARAERRRRLAADLRAGEKARRVRYAAVTTPGPARPVTALTSAEADAELAGGGPAGRAGGADPRPGPGPDRVGSAGAGLGPAPGPGLGGPPSRCGPRVRPGVRPGARSRGWPGRRRGGAAVSTWAGLQEQEDHYLSLPGANVVATPALLALRDNLADVLAAKAMMCVHGDAGLGKTLSVNASLRALAPADVCRVQFRARPTPRDIRHVLFDALAISGTPPTRPIEFDALLKDALSERFRVLVCDEAQWLSRECFELWRHLWDDRRTDIAIVFVGGGDCYQVLRREPMLSSRVYVWQEFRRLDREQVLAVIPAYHPVWAGADPADIAYADVHAGHGNFRAWSKITAHVVTALARLERGRPDREILQWVFSRLGGSGG